MSDVWCVKYIGVHRSFLSHGCFVNYELFMELTTCMVLSLDMSNSNCLLGVVMHFFTSVKILWLRLNGKRWWCVHCKATVGMKASIWLTMHLVHTYLLKPLWWKLVEVLCQDVLHISCLLSQKLLNLISLALGTAFM